jgi:hypothetical protein
MDKARKAGRPDAGTSNTADDASASRRELFALLLNDEGTRAMTLMTLIIATIGKREAFRGRHVMSRMFRFLAASMIVVLGFLGAMHSVSAQGGGTGTVTVLKYYCTYLNETALVEAIEIGQCLPGEATFTFYLVGDGTDDFQLLNVSGAGQGSIELSVSKYEVVEEGPQAHFKVHVLAGANV